MDQVILYVLFFLTTIWLWLLLLRGFIGFFNLDPYHPAVKVVMKLTEPLVKPFRFGFLLRPARIEPALFVPVIILFLVVSYLALILFTRH